MGSLKRRPTSVTKTTARRLIKRGLLEGHPLAWYAGSYFPEEQKAPRWHRVFATAKGCLALHAYDMELAFSGNA